MGLASNSNRNVSYRQPFVSTLGGNQPGLSDRKKYVQYNSAFSGNSTLVINSSSRTPGTAINNAVYRLNKPIIAYAVSLKSLILPVTWPNLTRDLYFAVTYNPGVNLTYSIGKLYLQFISRSSHLCTSQCSTYLCE